MKIKKIDNIMLEEMLFNGLLLLEDVKDHIDALNVFPVPDGDTGTNMVMTFQSAINEIRTTKPETVTEVGKALSKGSLKGARGNSGVILSQLMRGFYNGMEGKNELNAQDFAICLQDGVKTAYKAVMKPREGTILTVSRSVADKAYELAFEQDEEDIAIVMDKALEQGYITLDKTPDMLPVLKQAGVVDSGGKGLLYIYKGYLHALRGEEPVRGFKELTKPLASVKPLMNQIDPAEITFAYCTEFIINNVNSEVTEMDVNRFRNRLDVIGDSVVAVLDEDLMKVHVHTNLPGKALQYGLKFGDLHPIKIENMREQHVTMFEDEVTMEEPRKEFAMVTVAVGQGLKDIFKDVGVSGFVEGGQTMNPSTDDILAAIDAVNADNVYVMPNNGNIIMAAQQAAQLADCNVYVVPTKTIPQGIGAALAFNQDASAEDNLEGMIDALEYITTGEVTYAIRNSTFDGHEINEGDIMGLAEGTIKVVDTDVMDTTKQLIHKMVDEDSEIITLFFGEGVKEEDAQQLCNELEEEYEECDIEAHYGGQPLYYFIISVE